MNELNDEQLDLLLREHLSAELDPQLGKAPAAFEAKPRRRPTSWRSMLISLSIGGGFALAAAIGGLFIFAPLLKVMNKPDPRQIVMPVTPVSEPVEHEVAWNTVDQGTVFVNDDVPMRSVLRQRVDSLKWVDPDTHATIEMKVPRDEVVLVGLNAN
jgi:hypothetical protein